MVVVSMTRNLVAWPARDGRLPAVEGHHRTATGSRAVPANENWADGGLCLTRRVVEANKDFWSFETSIIMPSIHDLGREDPLQYWTTSDLGAVTLPIHCSFFSTVQYLKCANKFPWIKQLLPVLKCRALAGLKFDVRHSRVFWTKSHTNLLDFGASFVKKKVKGVKKACQSLWFWCRH